MLGRLVGKPDDPDIVAGDSDKIGVGEVKIVIGDAARKIVPESKAEVKAVEPAGRERAQILPPKVLIVIPRLSSSSLQNARATLRTSFAGFSSIVPVRCNAAAGWGLN